MVPLELLEQSLISLRMRNRNFKQNTKKTFWSQLFPRPTPLPDHRFSCVPDWKILYVKYLLGIAHMSSLLTKHSAYLCKKYPGNCAYKFLHSSIMTWYTKTSFNETGNLEIVSHQLKMIAVLLTQCCSCRLVISWEWQVPVSIMYFSISVDTWISYVISFLFRICSLNVCVF